MRHEFDFFTPWGELHRVRRELRQFAVNKQGPLALWVGEEGGKLRASLPGIAPDKLDISVLGRVVTLRGERRETAPQSEATHVRRERPQGAFHRQIKLPFKVDPQGVKASYNDGILTVTLPRAAEDKPQRITVQAA